MQMFSFNVHFVGTLTSVIYKGTSEGVGEIAIHSTNTQTAHCSDSPAFAYHLSTAEMLSP